LQFSGTGALSQGLYTEDFDSITPAGFTKGQFVRLFLGSDNIAAPSKPLASALTCSLHVSVTLEDSTTKDTTGDWEVQEPTGISYDISTSAMMENDETITSQVQGQTIANLETIYNNSQPVKFKIANTSGANNRTAGAAIVSGSVVITSLELQGPNRQTAQYQATLQGYGPYLVSA
jgi:predicted secreted protein